MSVLTDNGYERLSDMLFEDDEDQIKDFLLTEGKENEVMYKLEGNKTLLRYLLLIEQFFDELNVYMFKGWKEAEIIRPPVVEKFWVTIQMRMSPKADMRGLRRINDAIDQGTVKKHDLRNGCVLVTVEIPKRLLDQIDDTNNENIETLSDALLDEIMDQ